MSWFTYFTCVNIVPIIVELLLLFILLVDEEMLNKTNVVLICDGLDTIAEVTINGVHIGNSTNMFQRYVWDIKKVLVPGTNQILVAFTSAVTYSANKSRQYTYLIPPACPPPVQHGECHVNLIRKKQSSFAWVSGLC